MKIEIKVVIKIRAKIEVVSVVAVVLNTDKGGIE